MACGDFCIKSTSSVHLRDLDELVSSFNEERIAIDMKNRKLVSGNCPTRDRIEYMSVGTLSSTNEQEVASFEERFDGTVIEGPIKHEVAFDSTLESESDPGIDIQYSKNSLNLISELCDSLITASLPNNSKYCVSQLSRNETWASPIDYATGKLEPAYGQTMLPSEGDRPAKGSSCSRGYATQNTATLQASPLMIKMNFAMNKSNDGITAPLVMELSETEADKEAENNSNEQIGDYADQMPLDSCPQPIAAISRMQQMLERISLPLGRGAITNRTAKDRDCVSSDDSLQSTSACEIGIIYCISSKVDHSFYPTLITQASCLFNGRPCNRGRLYSML